MVSVVEDADDVRRKLGLRVVELRRASGVTQEELAGLLAMDPRDLRRVEAGETNVTIDTIVRIANTLNVAVAGLFSEPTGAASRDPGRPSRTRPKTR
jgi:transcriptional regulator with XRE-family HTH domain